MLRTQHFHCCAPGVQSLAGEQDSASHTAQPKKKKFKFQLPLITFDCNTATLVCEDCIVMVPLVLQQQAMRPTELTIFTYYLAHYRKNLPVSTLSPRCSEWRCANPTYDSCTGFFKAFQAKPNHLSKRC